MVKFMLVKIKIKNSIMILLVCSFFFILTACDPGNYFYDYEILNDNVKRIELINYDNDAAKFYNEILSKTRKEIISFDFDKMEIVEILNEIKIDDFIQNLSKINFLEYWNHSDSPVVMCIRMIYKNDDFEIISFNYYNNEYYNFVGKFDNHGNPIKFIGGFASGSDFVELVNNYFETQIE